VASRPGSTEGVKRLGVPKCLHIRAQERDCVQLAAKRRAEAISSALHTLIDAHDRAAWAGEVRDVERHIPKPVPRSSIRIPGPDFTDLQKEARGWCLPVQAHHPAILAAR
jgi:hypothetical protein